MCVIYYKLRLRDDRTAMDYILAVFFTEWRFLISLQKLFVEILRHFDRWDSFQKIIQFVLRSDPILNYPFQGYLYALLRQHKLKN